ncbi:hypothetical protein A0128_14935 [Leptospira tipperaryensis]|uniref:Uncharacterized protein n=1 Tax=Leptospira tipperaryensis TaxID=2564040 RepID=A0A1D7UZM5_9LEPT|nr:hypothetical protein A0128_14935 [Leptospira tipperaryensis]
METKYTLPVSGATRFSPEKTKSSRTFVPFLLGLFLVLQIHPNSFSDFAFKDHPSNQREFFSSQYIRKIKYSKIQKLLRMKQHALALRAEMKMYKTFKQRNASKTYLFSTLPYSDARSC